MSGYFSSSKPSFFSEMKKRNFSEAKKDSQSSNNGDPKKQADKGISNGATSRGTTSSKRGVSSGIGGLDYVPSPQVGIVTPLSSQPPPPQTGATPTTETTPTHPVPKPRVKRDSVTNKTPPTNKSPVCTTPTQPKPRTRSFDGEEFEIVSMSTSTTPTSTTPTSTPPVPTPRKNINKEVKPNDSPRQQAYSKGTKEYKAHKKDDLRPNSAKPPPQPPIVTPPTLSPYVPPPSRDIPVLPFHHITLDEGPRSIINIIDLDIQTSIRSQYLTKEEMEGNGEHEEDSDEETNKQIQLMETTPFMKSDEDISTPTVTELTRTNKHAPPKPPRARSRSPSPGIKRKQSSPQIPHPSGVGNCDPTVGLTKSQSYIEVKSEKKPKKGIFRSPFGSRKKMSGKKEGSWDLPKQGSEEQDSESIISETGGTLSPTEYPLHRTSKVKDLKVLLAKEPLINVNKRDWEYNTPLHYILKMKRSQRCELIMVLLQTGRVDVNSLDVDDNTPLHIAAKHNDHKCGAILLAFNANPFITNSQGLTPIQLTNEGSSLHNLLSQQFKPSADDCVTLSSLPEVVVPLDPQELVNEHIGRLLQPDKINSFIQKLGDKIREIELEAFESGPPSLNQLTRGEDDFRQCLHDQKYYLNNWKRTSGSRVLFLDGGGIRGLIQIEVLMELERRTGRRVTELFDWIVGTSTGGIVALGLVYGGKTLQQMRNFYFTIKNEVFGGAGLAGTFINMSQKSKKLEKILKEGFGVEMKMTDVTHPRVMICAVDKQHSPLKVVFFNNFMDKKELKDVLVWKVARATSAAPMYFTDCDGKYVDGGVLANNPCDIAMTHIYEYNRDKGLPKRHFALAVSIGTGIFPERDLGSGDGKDFGMFNLKKQLSMVKELTRLFMETLAHSEIAAKNFAAHFDNEIPFFRFNPQLRNAVTTGETDDVQLIDMLLVTKLYLAEEDTQKKFNALVEIFKRLQSDK